MELIIKNNEVYIINKVDWNKEIDDINNDYFYTTNILPDNYKNYLSNDIINVFYNSNQPIELCKQVLNNCPSMLAFIKNPTRELYDIALKNINDGYIENQIIILFIDDIEYIKSIPNYEDIFFNIFKYDKGYLRFIKKEFQTYEMVQDIINYIYSKYKNRENNLECLHEKIDLYSYIKNFDIKICDLILKHEKKEWYNYIKNVDYLVDNKLVNIEIKKLDNCVICDNLKKYYVSYECNIKHIICYDCGLLNESCYYKCDKANLDYSKIYINTKFEKN